MDRRAELEGWIAKTHRLQRRLAFAYAALGIVAIAVFAMIR
jgi:hypothetical protein